MKTLQINLKFTFFGFLAAALLVLPVFLSADPVVSFSLNNLESYTPIANWMFDYDNAGLPTHDMNPYTYSPAPVYPYHNFSHKYVHQVPATTNICISENIGFVANPAEISINYSQFELVAYEKINTVNPTLPWSIPGQSGDRRTYTNSTGTIYHNGNPVLVLSNITLIIDTPYPTAAQFHAAGAPFLGWVGDLGTGLPQTAHGYAEINVGASDPAWVALFGGVDNNIMLDLSNIVYLAQPTYGLFWFNLELNPSAVPTTFTSGVVTAPSQTLFNPAFGLSLQVDSFTPGGQSGTESGIAGLKTTLVPLADLWPIPLSSPPTEKFLISTSCEALGYSLTFVHGLVKAPTEWKIMYRPNEYTPWVVWADVTTIDPTHLRANNITGGGEFALGSNTEVTLPVELSSFVAVQTAENFVSVKWATESESQLLGYRVYRSETQSAETAIMLNSTLIPAGNTSTHSNYSLADYEVAVGTTYYYWLQSVDMSGGSMMFGPTTITVGGEGTPEITDVSMLNSAYPNPFRIGGSTNIEVAVKSGETGTVTIYNSRGQIVKVFPVNAGTQILNWDGSGAGSGMYFYKLSTPTRNITKKLMIIN
jgi:hypothetical protein